MKNKIESIKDNFEAIQNYSPQLSILKESGFLAKGTNSFGVFEYIDPNQNISYAVKTFIYNINENMDYIYKYLNDLSQRKLQLNCLVEYKGFYYELSENQSSIKINIVFDKFSGDLTALIQNLSYTQIKKVIENLIFSCCELIGFGYVLQNYISLKEIKYVESNAHDFQVKFIKPYLIEKLTEVPSLQAFYTDNKQIFCYDSVKFEIKLLGGLILQILGNYTKIFNNQFQTSAQFLNQFSQNENLNDLFLNLSKGLEKENVHIPEIQQLVSILKQMVNPVETKIFYPIQLYFQWLNFTNQQELYPIQSHENELTSPLKINTKDDSNEKVKPNLQISEIPKNQIIMSDEQQAENTGKDQLDMQDDSVQENQGFNYPSLEELQKNLKYTYQTGATYEGEWLNGKRNGYGTLVTVKGSRFIGNWIEDKFTGKGIVHYFSGSVLEGSWLNGQAQGYGILKNQSGAIYEGNFENNKKNGFGVEKLANGTIYSGLFKNDEKTFGHFQFFSGNRYTGTIIKGKFNGFGQLFWADGRIYHGNFVNNQLDGPGIYNQVNGNVYQGCFKKNQYYGFGILSMPTRIEYGGAWVANKLNGYGFLSKAGKAQLVEWKNSKIVKKIENKIEKKNEKKIEKKK